MCKACSSDKKLTKSCRLRPSRSTDHAITMSNLRLSRIPKQPIKLNLNAGEQVATYRSGGHDVTSQPTNAARRWASTSTAVLGSAGNWRTVAS